MRRVGKPILLYMLSSNKLDEKEGADEKQEIIAHGSVVSRWRGNSAMRSSMWVCEGRRNWYLKVFADKGRRDFPSTIAWVEPCAG